MDEISNKSIWDKTPEELTVGEQYKLVLGMTAISVGITVAVSGACIGAAYAWEAYQARKAEKARKKHEEEDK